MTRYSVNVPMVPELLEDKMLPLHTTTIWHNGYGRLFKAYDEEKAPKLEQQTKPEAGPDAQQGQSWRDHDAAGQGQKQPAPEDVGDLVFKWAPEMKGIINPKEGECPSESDAFILGKGFVSITPLRATFAQPPSVGRGGEYKL
jgi:tubulin--tyrosine ligase